MSKFAAFMAENVVKIPNQKVVVSERFRDDKGKPIEWEIKAVSSEENDLIQRDSIVTINAGRRGAVSRELDNVKYTSLLLAASVVYPDLNDAELQDSYHVKSATALLKAMLYPSEEAVLAQAVTALQTSEDIEDLATEAKN